MPFHLRVLGRPLLWGATSGYGPPNMEYQLVSKDPLRHHTLDYVRWLISQTTWPTNPFSYLPTGKGNGTLFKGTNLMW